MGVVRAPRGRVGEGAEDGAAHVAGEELRADEDDHTEQDEREGGQAEPAHPAAEGLG